MELNGFRKKLEKAKWKKIQGVHFIFSSGGCLKFTSHSPPPCSPFVYFFWMKYVCPLPPLNVFINVLDVVKIELKNNKEKDIKKIPLNKVA